MSARKILRVIDSEDGRWRHWRGKNRGNTMLMSPRPTARPALVRSVQVTARSRSLEGLLIAAFAVSILAMLITPWLPLVFIAGGTGTAALLAEARDVMRY